MDRQVLLKFGGIEGAFLVNKVCDIVDVYLNADNEIRNLNREKKSVEASLRDTSNEIFKSRYISRLNEIELQIESLSYPVWLGVDRDEAHSLSFFGQQLGTIQIDGRKSALSVEDKRVNLIWAKTLVLRVGEQPDDTAVFIPMTKLNGKVKDHGNELSAIIYLWTKLTGEQPLIAANGEFCLLVANTLHLDRDTVYKYLLKFAKYSNTHCETMRN